MRVNVTAGECLNEILKGKYPDERFVPFNEAMIQGGYSSPLFCEGFVKERSAVHGVSEAEYLSKLAEFMEVLRRLDEYDEIVLWFGDEPFCIENRNAVLKALEEHGYRGAVLLNVVDEESGDIVRQERIN